MVLATLRRYQLWCLLLFIIINSCQFQEDTAPTQSTTNQHAEVFQVTEEVVIDGRTLQLTQMENTCVLRALNQEHPDSLPLSLKPPCHLVLNPDGKVRREHYHRPQKITVIIVLGNQPPADPLTPISLRDDCGRYWKGVLISQDNLQLSPRTGEGMACAGVGLDEKEYWLFMNAWLTQ